MLHAVGTRKARRGGDEHGQSDEAEDGTAKRHVDDETGKRAMTSPGEERSRDSYRIFVRSVSRPVESGTVKQFCRYLSQEVCPWNVKFARELSEPSFAGRPALAGRDSRSLALDLLAISPAEFSGSFKGSPMKRAELRGLKRNASVVLGNVGSEADVPALAAALEESEPSVRPHAAWALGRIGCAPVAYRP
ncbi:MAG: hypothetical protein ACHQRK_04550 [Gemmatimonadales bacterium]